MAPPLKESRLVRIAENLGNLPFELIHEVLKNLQLLHVLQLFLLSSPGSHLRGAIQTCPDWLFYLGEETDELEHYLTILDQLMKLGYNRSWYDEPTVARRLESLVRVEYVRPLSYDKGWRMKTKNVWEDKKALLETLKHPIYAQFRALIGIIEWSGRIRASQALEVAFYYLPDDSILRRWTQLRVVPGEEDPPDSFVYDIVREFWNNFGNTDLVKVILELKDAYSQFCEQRSAELNRLADLYERFPRFLKVANAPELPTNEAHILTRLRQDASRQWKYPVKHDHPYNEDANQRQGWYRFRYPHSTLVPFQWCLQLIKTLEEPGGTSKAMPNLPPHISPHYDRVMKSLDWIECHNPLKRLRRTSGVGKDVTFVNYPGHRGILVHPIEETGWLESFAILTEWMTKEFPELAYAVTSAHMATLRRRLLIEPSDCKRFVEEESMRVIARQLRADLEACRADATTKLPSLVAYYVPPWPSQVARAVAQLLAPQCRGNEDLLQLTFESTIAKIRHMIGSPPRSRVSSDGTSLIADMIENDGGSVPDSYPLHDTESTTSETLSADRDHQDSDVTDTMGDDAPDEPKKSHRYKDQRYKSNNDDINEEDMITTINTLQKLVKQGLPSSKNSLTELLNDLLSQADTSGDGDSVKPERTSNADKKSSWEDSMRRFVKYQKQQRKRPHCYICGREITRPHQIMSSMCLPCGDFNLAGSELSQPSRLSLEGKVAVVTGARVNLGYHVTLRLLRCGAKVIASTRYPHDAVLRYQRENDACDWVDNLRIVGADFRSARDAFELAAQIQAVVKDWGGTLHILINNAAQTLTDSVEKENRAVQKEVQLSHTISPLPLLPSTSYVPRIRAGKLDALEGLATQEELTHAATKEAERGSSWVQSLSEIPYEDVISAHSVNAFVPMILIRELLPLMCNSEASGKHAHGYVVNVSSREGIFEHTGKTTRWSKNGTHVHTNMSKAALNMITETEAVTAWEKGRIAINTVDPGFMSAAPELESLGVRPIGWEDGAGRVLWPIAVGELHKRGEDGFHVVWGRFLKHYGAARVNLLQGI